MNKSLLVVERMVLESLETRGRGLEELKEQTGMSDQLLKAVLHQLLERGMIRYFRTNYEIDWKNKDNWLSILKDQNGMKAEIKELFSSLVNKSFPNEKRPRRHMMGQTSSSSSLKMKKVWLEPIEQEELERKLKDIDFFLDNIQKRRRTKPVREVICGKKVIFYGSCQYRELMDELVFAS